MRRWGTAALVFALLAATAVAFATTERQKLEASPFAVLHVTKDFSPLHRAATIVLRLHHPHLLTVEILNTRDRTVGTLARDERYERGTIKFRWVARAAADGVYTPRVTLDQSRVFTLPDHIHVDTVAPRITLAAYRPRVVRRRRKPLIHISYTVSEPAHAILYVDGQREVVGFPKAIHAHIEWYATRAGRRLRPGRYRLQLAAVDLAGNRGRRTRPFVVRIR